MKLMKLNSLSAENPAEHRNSEFLRRNIKRLWESKDALTWLFSFGLTEETIRYFKLGLSMKYVDTHDVPHENALIAPVIGKNGNATKQSVFFNIPGVSINPRHPASWTRGDSLIYSSTKFENQTMVFVCSDAKEVWRMHQLLLQHKIHLNILFTSQTPGGHFPAEWHKSLFWRRFERVYLGFENNAAGDMQALELARISGCEMRRVRPSGEFGTNWIDFWKNGGDVAAFHRLLSDSTVIGGIEPIAEITECSVPGRFGYRPIDVSRTFHNGFLYYPVLTINNFYETNVSVSSTIEEKKSRIETIFVRSDGTLHSVKEEPYPRGTPPSERVLRLTDGTLISSRQQASPHASWDYDSILKFCQGKSKTRTLNLILKDIKKILSSSVWLPFKHDYDLLTLLVPVSFAQAVFDSVPLILVTGPPGSGKSALGSVMCSLCANATVIGQASAATVARRIDETRGFVVLDDFESIVRKSRGDNPLLSEIVQALKLSYNKETSRKILTISGRGKGTEEVNFFGVKMINNTRGADHILGTRLLEINSQKIPAGSNPEIFTGINWNKSKLEGLRNELHTWTFQNVSLIAETYRRLFPQSGSRHEEITAPLKVFAELADDEELSDGLFQALNTKSEISRTAADPVDLLKQAVKKLIIDGYRSLSTTHIVLEMKALAQQNNFIHDDSNDKWHNPAWVGRQLRTYEIVEFNVPPVRENIHGMFLRIYPIREPFIKKLTSEIRDSFTITKSSSMEFCNDCQNCRYTGFNCPIQRKRY